MAGVVGIDPGPFTLRELCLMHEGREKFHWDIASVNMALFANAHRDAKKRPTAFTPDDFHPYRRPSSGGVIPIEPEDTGAALKKFFSAMR